MQTVAMLVAEQGTDWPDWVEALRCGTSDVVVLVQRSDEDRGRFVARANQRMNELLQAGVVLRSAGLLGDADGQPNATVHRADLLRRMASWMGREMTGGRLFIDMGHTPGHDGAQSLASAVSRETQGTKISVSVGRPGGVGTAATA